MDHHKDDEGWIKKQLRKLSPRMRVDAAREYRILFKKIYRETDGTIYIKVEAARRGANTYLRGCINNN